jgi:hypothetical protein
MSSAAVTGVETSVSSTTATSLIGGDAQIDGGGAWFDGRRQLRSGKAIMTLFYREGGGTEKQSEHSPAVKNVRDGIGPCILGV